MAFETRESEGSLFANDRKESQQRQRKRLRPRRISMTTYRFRARRVPANAPRRRGVPGALDLAALCALAGRQPPHPAGESPPDSLQRNLDLIPRIGGGYVR